MMPSSANNSVRSQTSTPWIQPSSQASDSAIADIPTEHMFRLIDSILPFEACLYYQFVPLALEGKYLKLGMVTPTDSSALDYVRHILAYLHCSFKTEAITHEVHQALLSAYLNHIQSATSSPSTPHAQQQVAQSESLQNNEKHSQGNEEDLEDVSISETTDRDEAQNNGRSSLVTSTATPALSQDRFEGRTQQNGSSAVTPEVPALAVQALYLSQPIEFLATLAPQQLLQELLGRMLQQGIGRLYFERQSQQGRILWSEDGVLQSILDGVTLKVFQGVIIELKRLFQLPLLPVRQAKQVEIERSYGQECLLLRLRVMPGTHGEEATIQVLRGVALKFYQRQQLEKLGQEALNLAQELQHKLKEIGEVASRYPEPVNVLPALNQLLGGLDQQLKGLGTLKKRHCDH